MLIIQSQGDFMVTLSEDLGMKQIKKRRVRRALLLCDCGKTYERDMQDFKRKKTLRCKECKSKLKRTHNQSNTRLYAIWGGMIQRTTNKKRDTSNGYANKGITVCKKWKNSFENFRDWSLENGYNEKLTIDRKDSDKNSR